MDAIKYIKESGDLRGGGYTDKYYSAIRKGD